MVKPLILVLFLQSEHLRRQSNINILQFKANKPSVVKKMPQFSRLLAEDVRSLLKGNYSKIKTGESGPYKRKQNIICFEYTFCLADENNPFSIEQLFDKLWVFKNQFKINFAFGYILREESLEARYFHPSDQNTVQLDTAFLIAEDSDKARFQQLFNQGQWLDLETHIKLRPDTKTRVVCLASIKFYVYVLQGFFQNVGAPLTALPDFFKKTRSIFTLLNDSHGKPYNDHLCFITNVICAQKTASGQPKLRTQQHLTYQDVENMYDEL